MVKLYDSNIMVRKLSYSPKFPPNRALDIRTRRFECTGRALLDFDRDFGTLK